MSLSLNLRRSSICPYKPTLTQANLDDQGGKVFIVTGGSGGLGKELVKILYQHNARIYIAARSEEKTNEIIAESQDFLARETRLDILWNNAGVMVPPKGSKTKQGYELQLGVNNLAHFLLTHFLRPVLEKTAQVAPKNSVRVIWVSSSAADAAPNPAIDFSNMDYHKEEGIWQMYSRSKAGNVIHSCEFARRTKGSGIISLALNPGNFVTNLQDNMPKLQLAVFKMIASEPINGAYTELFAGLSPSITETNNGGWVSPFGKIEAPAKTLSKLRLETSTGNGLRHK
ncbi:hypothetical protein TrVFT333_007775 [Trichoderma virens FT-333]|nr:hypothetical protein TrVFT333_007775 [Trichoderma virens FT-333]